MSEFRQLYLSSVNSLFMAKPKQVEGLDCGAGVTESVRLVLLSRFAEIVEYQATALDFTKIEGVHDMRVATRRLRSALKDFAPYLSRARRLERMRGELKKTADALGRVRDQDVALKALDKLADDAPAEARAGVLKLIEERNALRAEARAALTLALDVDKLEELRRVFTRAVEASCVERDGDKKGGVKKGGVKKGGGDLAGESFSDLGCAVVNSSWRELSRLAVNLYRPHKPKPIHKMRIVAKRLRYSLELYSTCWGETAKDLAKEISDLQDALGEMHDCDEWIGEIGERLSRETGKNDGRDATPGEAGDSGDGRAGLVWLLDHFTAERTKHYREALRLWSEWERDDFADRITACTTGEAQSASDAARIEAGV